MYHISSFCLRGSNTESGYCRPGFYCPTDITNPFLPSSLTLIGSYGPEQVSILLCLFHLTNPATILCAINIHAMFLHWYGTYAEGLRTFYEPITNLPSRLHSILCKIQNIFITFDIVIITGLTYKTNVTKVTIMKRSVNGDIKYIHDKT